MDRSIQSQSYRCLDHSLLHHRIRILDRILHRPLLDQRWQIRLGKLQRSCSVEEDGKSGQENTKGFAFGENISSGVSHLHHLIFYVVLHDLPFKKIRQLKRQINSQQFRVNLDKWFSKQWEQRWPSLLNFFTIFFRDVSHTSVFLACTVESYDYFKYLWTRK